MESLLRSGHPLWVAGATLLGLSFIYCFGISIYRLYFHPYAKYPGPFLGRISFLPAFYHALIGDVGDEHFRCHLKYGPIVRYHPDLILFNNPNAQKDIHGAAKNFTKGKAYDNMNADPDHTNMAFTSDKKDHARRRRIIAQGFSERAVRDAQQYIKVHADKFCDMILAQSDSGNKWSQPINMKDPLFWMTVDTTTDLIFGESFNNLEEPKWRMFGSMLQQSVKRLGLVLQVPWLFRPGIGHWLDYGTWFLPNIVPHFIKIANVAAELTTKRIEKPTDRKDVLGYLINGTDPETGKSFPTEDIIQEAMVLLLAGGDVMATTLQIILFNLIRNPKALEKVTDEVRSTFKSADEVVLGDKMDSLVYMDAVIAEGLRNLVTGAFTREAMKGGAMVQGEYIPEGLCVGTSFMALFFRDEEFPDPFVFKPERWIPGPDVSDAQLKAMRTARQPFSQGPRSCVAKNLAYGILRLCLATILTRMDLKKADGDIGNMGGGGWTLNGPSPERIKLTGAFTVSASGPVVQVKPPGLKVYETV